MTDRDDEIQELLDKQAVTELLTRYFRSVDRGDVATLRSCYLPGATEDHGGLWEGPAEQYVESIAASVTHPKSLTSHVLSNVLIELDGDAALVESYATTFARVKKDGERFDCFVGARIIDRMQRREGKWGIAHRQLLWEWSLDVPSNETWVKGYLTADVSRMRHGSKFPDDPVFRG
ncbi:MAG: nuclear transport factor 2 family protein [Acidimicrobiales bacterium]